MSQTKSATEWAETSVCDVDVDESPKMATNRLELEPAGTGVLPAGHPRPHSACLEDLVNLIAFQTGSLEHLQKGIGTRTPER